MIDKSGEREDNEGAMESRDRKQCASPVKFKLNLTILHSTAAACRVFLEGIKMRLGP